MAAAPPQASSADKLAFAISAVASPFLILPAFIGVLVADLAETAGQAWLWTGVAVGGTVAVPLLYILVGVRKGTITDPHIMVLEQRRRPFFAAVAGAVLAAGLLRLIGAPEPLQLGAAAVAINGMLFGVISLRWKISMHPSTLAAAAVLCGMILSPRWLWALVAVPAVIWARVHRKRHDWAQGIAAVLLACVVTAAMTWLYLSVSTPVGS